MKLKINGSYYLYFNDFTMTSSLDSVASTFAFTMLFDPKNQVHKKLVRPLSFHQVEFYDEVTNALYLTGQIISHEFNSKASPELVQISGYSLGGILEDCTIPYSAYPLESLNRNLREISEKLLALFGLKLKIYDNVKADCNHPYKKSVAKPTGTVKDYLSKLAAQRNIIMSHEVDGTVIFFRPDAKAASKGFYTKENTLNMGLNVNGQGMHSTITAMRQPSKKKATDGGLFDEETPSVGVAAVDTLKNSLIIKFRPMVDLMSSGTETDTSYGVKNMFATELKNIKVGFELDRWDALNIGDIVEVQNEEIFLYSRTRLIIESLSKIEDAERKSMVLTLVLPETFTGDQPKNIFS